MNANKVLIFTTPSEIAEGISMILNQYANPKPEPDFESEKMTVAAAAMYIGVSYQTMITWVKQNKIPVHGTGRTRFVLKSELVDAYKRMKP